MEDEKVKQLAETLKKHGLAASMYDAMEKAKSILNVKSQIDEVKDQRTKEMPRAFLQDEYTRQQGDKDNKLPADNYDKLDYDITKETASLNELMLNELLEEIGVTPEQVKEQEKRKIAQIREEVNEIKEGLREAEQNPEKAEEIKEDIAHINEEIGEIIEERTGEEAETRQEPEQSQEEPEADGEKSQQS